LLVTEELVRAVRTESVLAICYWFGVYKTTVWRWRKAFGVMRLGTEGSRRLHQAVSETAAAKVRGKKLSKAIVERRLAVRREKGSLRQPDRWGDKKWQQWQLDLLGTEPDAELAACFGRDRCGRTCDAEPPWEAGTSYEPGARDHSDAATPPLGRVAGEGDGTQVAFAAPFLAAHGAMSIAKSHIFSRKFWIASRAWPGYSRDP
jgi:hypothetical protein